MEGIKEIKGKQVYINEDRAQAQKNFGSSRQGRSSSPGDHRKKKKIYMSKEEAIEVEGIVIKALSNAKFQVEIQSSHKVIAYPSGKMRKFFIKILPGDRVTLALSPYDLSNGRIIFRHKS